VSRKREMLVEVMLRALQGTASTREEHVTAKALVTRAKVIAEAAVEQLEDLAPDDDAPPARRR